MSHKRHTLPSRGIKLTSMCAVIQQRTRGNIDRAPSILTIPKSALEQVIFHYGKVSIDNACLVFGNSHVDSSSTGTTH